MSNKITVLDVKNSRIPPVCNICPTDSRLIQWLNEAVERLIYEGKFWGLCVKLQMCATDGCITMPPQVATIEAVNVCGQPTPIRDFWWEFLQNGYGSVSSPSGSCQSGGGCGIPEAVMRGEYPSFADIIGTNKKLNLICDLATDVGKAVLILGYDQNGNWIRTLQNGVYADGEIVALAQGVGTTTANFFSTLAGIQFNTARDGQVWLYEYNTSDTTKRRIGTYQYWETRPSYQRYFFPSISPSSSSGTCNTVKVEIVAKLNFVPVSADTDYVMIACMPALKEMIRAIKLSEDEADGMKGNDILVKGLGLAKAILDKQLDHFFGTGRRIGINVVGSGVGSADPIPTLI